MLFINSDQQARVRKSEVISDKFNGDPYRMSQLLLIDDRTLCINYFIIPTSVQIFFNTLKRVKYLKYSYMFRHYNVIIRE